MAADAALGDLDWGARRPGPRQAGRPRSPRLTQAEWRAIGEALNHRLAGPIEDTEEEPGTYESAVEKVYARIR
jgi:hypothetical protein